MSGSKSVGGRKGLPIAIVGGGVGGLTLALALRQRGLEADVYEQAPELTEIGAAVALSANSIRELERLGLLEQLAEVSTEPNELIYRDWRQGRRIAAFPVRKDSVYRKRCGAPYFGIHRAEFQRVLSGAVGPARLHLGQRVNNLLDQRRYGRPRIAAAPLWKSATKRWRGSRRTSAGSTNSTHSNLCPRRVAGPERSRPFSRDLMKTAPAYATQVIGS
jgi:hypothetical protein